MALAANLRCTNCGDRAEKYGSKQLCAKCWKQLYQSTSQILGASTQLSSEALHDAYTKIAQAGISASQAMASLTEYQRDWANAAPSQKELKDNAVKLAERLNLYEAYEKQKAQAESLERMRQSGSFTWVWTVQACPGSLAYRFLGTGYQVMPLALGCKVCNSQLLFDAQVVWDSKPQLRVIYRSGHEPLTTVELRMHVSSPKDEDTLLHY